MSIVPGGYRFRAAKSTMHIVLVLLGFATAFFFPRLLAVMVPEHPSTQDVVLHNASNSWQIPLEQSGQPLRCEETSPATVSTIVHCNHHTVVIEYYALEGIEDPRRSLRRMVRAFGSGLPHLPEEQIQQPAPNLYYAKYKDYGRYPEKVAVLILNNEDPQDGIVVQFGSAPNDPLVLANYRLLLEQTLGEVPEDAVLDPDAQPLAA